MREIAESFSPEMEAIPASMLDWAQQRSIWIGAFFFQAALAIVFAGLHYLRLRTFVGPNAAA